MHQGGRRLNISEGLGGEMFEFGVSKICLAHVPVRRLALGRSLAQQESPHLPGVSEAEPDLLAAARTLGDI
jgi:hypothetical protein